ncbi:MAG: response regulator transcription factor [candidate division Zixibacteria bacterium]|nr:response regulator transcription factor [candidate division Zixibacteria bacterium]
MKILLIEDEPRVARAVQEGLQAEGFRVTIAATGEDGFFRATTEPYDLILLDLMLPGRDGLEILTALRAQKSATPVLVLTARDTVQDRVCGLDAGADDYLIKPFAFPELLARIRALARRGRSDAPPRFVLADLALDVVARTCVRNGQNIQLTNREFDLLEYLLRHAGHTVTREMLARDVWQVTERMTPLNNVIDVHIARLRAKMDTPFTSRLLRTIRGVGFVLAEETS